MNTGPVAERGFDLALTEVLDGGRHYFVVEVGTERGAELLADVAAHDRPATTPSGAGRGRPRAHRRRRWAASST